MNHQSLVCCLCTIMHNTGLEFGPSERATFVGTLMRLIERGQYNKNGSLASIVGNFACLLAFVEPSLMLPHIVSTFDTILVSVSFFIVESSWTCGPNELNKIKDYKAKSCWVQHYGCIYVFQFINVSCGISKCLFWFWGSLIPILICV